MFFRHFFPFITPLLKDFVKFVISFKALDAPPPRVLKKYNGEIIWLSIITAVHVNVLAVLSFDFLKDNVSYYINTGVS